MARPEKQGLDYFSMDVEKDNKIKFLKAKFGVCGFGMYIELLQFIYKQGYYTIRDDDSMLLFMSETGLKEEETKLMLEFMLDKGLFNKLLYEKYNILTSTGIQKRYAEGTKKRKNTTIQKVYRVVGEYEHIELKEELTELKEELTELLPTESTQSKVKESKLNYEYVLKTWKQASDLLNDGGYVGLSIPLRRSEDLEKARKVLDKKGVTNEERVQGLRNYVKDIEKRNKEQSYATHRFKLLEFLTRKGGLVTFI